jgi:hypothetical protein
MCSGPELEQMLGSKPLLRPAGLRRQPNLDEESQVVITAAIFYKSFHLMLFGQDPHCRATRKRALCQYLGEPLPDLFQVAEYALWRTTIRPGDENYLGTQVSARRF